MRIHIASVFGLIFLIHSPEFYTLLLIIILIHEYGHIIAARMCHFEINGIIILPPVAGLSFITFGNSTQLRNIIVYLSGSGLNIVTAVTSNFLLYNITSILPYVIAQYINQFVNISIAIAILNLIPLYPLDGGKILLEVLSLGNISIKKAESVAFYVSLAVFIPIAALTVKTKDWIDLLIASLLMTISFITLKS